MKYFTKSHIFLYIVASIAIFVLYKTLSLPYDGIIKVNISKQKGSIVTLDTPRKIANTQRISIERLFFPKSRMLSERRLGKLGFSQNFFIDAVVDMEVQEAGEYQFSVFSDDGFRLKIDEKIVCEHPDNRPYGKTECTTTLSKAIHHFELSYFQGGGPLGLHVRYGRKGEKLYDIGKDSKFIVFKERL